jgi:hypothetical protein
MEKNWCMKLKENLLPYDTENNRFILQKNGKNKLDESEDQLLSGLMTNKTRYILMFPRDISHIILKEY